MNGVLEQFHPLVRAWFIARFGEPSPAQVLGWPVIAQAHDAPAHDVLLCAPTGSGKTLAAFMWAINRLVLDAERGALADKISVLYVSPLKALANDIRLNLDEPLGGIRAAAAVIGLDLGRIRAGLRTGDTSAGERNAMLRRPPQILVTTPESLFILLTSARFRPQLEAVRYVIVDELHALAGNKRGAHLMLSLERLEHLIRRGGAPRPTRIGLSATLNPIETLGAFLAGGEIGEDGVRAPREVRIVRADETPRQLDLKIIAPGPALGSLATHQHWEAMYDALAALLREHRTTLIFTLSRRWAERIALALQKRVGADAIMAHHGSLARTERLQAEQRLKHGELKAIVATSSLELGIDVGSVDLVCQIDSPKSVASAIQRIGRSGHSLGGTPKGYFFALTIEDLLECAAAVQATRLAHLDEVEIPRGCLDVAAQQIVALMADHEMSDTELLGLLRSAHNFSELSMPALRRLLSQMAAQLPERIQGAAPKIFYDAGSGRVRARRGARLAAIMSGGTIPESGNLDVVIASEGRKIGDVEEDFAQESSRGDIFSLGSMPWRVLGISKNRFLVEPAPAMAPSLPFWQTEANGRSRALSLELCELRRRIAASVNERGESATLEWLGTECALEPDAAKQAIAYIQRGMAALGAMPDEHTVVVERFFDGLGGTQIVLHSPFGMRFNRGWGLALRKRLCQSFDFEIQASALDDAVLLALNSRHSFTLDYLLGMVGIRNIGEILQQAVLDAPMFEVRFRHVATRALALMRTGYGRKVPAWIQRLRSQELITALFPQRNACFDNRPAVIELPAHFIVSETMRECLEESADLPYLLEVLRGLEEGSIRTVLVDSVAPSVFAHRVLLAWDYSFLDDGERANRRSRTVTMNRAMAEEVFRSEDLAELLSAEAVEQVTAQLDGRTPSARARDPDELYELIRTRGTLPVSGVAERTTVQPTAILSALHEQGRICRVRAQPEASELLIAAEDLPLLRQAYDRLVFNQPARSVAEESAPDKTAAIEEIVRRAMVVSAPATVSELAARLDLPVQGILSALTALEAKGGIFRGHFTRIAELETGQQPSSSEQDRVQWCDRYVLERIHRQTLNLLRSSVEPCSDDDFVAFRLKWNGIGGNDDSLGLDGVRAVMNQMTGLAFTPGFWENALLPARVADYRPEHLDLLCMSGEIAWVALPLAAEREANREIPSTVAFLPRHHARSWPSRPLPDRPQAQTVAGVLMRFGAQYLDQIAERANLSERDTLAELWRLAAAAFVSNDSFAPMRLLAAEPDAAKIIGERPIAAYSRRRDAALRARLRSSVAGRWSLLPAVEFADAAASDDSPKAHRFDKVGEIAAQLLQRHGILAREMMALEQLEISWDEILFALRRMEYAGTARRGWFVRALSGEQYALPEALEMLRAIRTPSEAVPINVVISAADPANPYGVLLPGCGIPRDAANLLVINGGRVVAGLAGRTLSMFVALDEDGFAAVVRRLITVRLRLLIENIDGEPALESGRVSLMAAIGFHSDGRALVYDGFPGPKPARARHYSAVD